MLGISEGLRTGDGNVGTWPLLINLGNLYPKQSEGGYIEVAINQ